MLLKSSSKYFAILLFVFVSTIVNGQIKIGLNSGVNIASYTLSKKAPDATLESKTGFSIRAIVEFPLLQKLSVRIVPMYIQRGGKTKIGDNTSEIYYDYLALAPYLTYSFIDSNISAKVIGGLSFGYLVFTRAEYDGGEIDLMSLTNRFNLTTDFGCEIEINISQKLSFIVGGIYSIGQSDLSKATGETKTKDLQLSVGILFDLRKS